MTNRSNQDGAGLYYQADVTRGLGRIWMRSAVSILVLCFFTVFATRLPGSELLPANFPPHPRLLLNVKDAVEIKARIAKEKWAQAGFEKLKAQAEDWLKTGVVLPPRGGQWFHYYSCPKHGARLRTEWPTRHVCPIDKEVLTGYPYDDVVLMSDHNRLANGLRSLGLVYQLTEERRYAAKAKEILLAYAEKYQSYPLHTIKGEAKIGGGKVGPQTLDESTWLITMVEGADCIWESLSEGEQEKVKEGLLYPAIAIIRSHKMGIHNIQCWKNSAVGLTGLLMGDRALVEEALNGEAGYFKQMAKGVTPDGAWHEGAWGYHFYTLSAVAHLTEGALHSGINLYSPECKGMFDAPLAMAMPDLRLPAFNDSHEVSIVGSAALYETALARYGDARYRGVAARGKRDSVSALLHGVADVGTAAAFVPASKNYPDSGYAILSAGQGSEAGWLSLDYGPHGGGHGHPDKLGFVLYGFGEVLAPDPGTANYGVPIQGGWYRTTIAHNTLTVDEVAQKAAEGKCEAFVSEAGFSAVMASAGKIYDGVSFRRTIALIGTKILVFADQIQADKEHVFDLAYHNVGKLLGGSGESGEISKANGYSYLRDTRKLTSGNGLQVSFRLSNGREVRWAMAGGEATTFITGTGVGAHTEDRVPVVIARRNGKATVFLWAVSLDEEEKSLRVTAEPVEGPSDAAGVRVQTRGGWHVLVANPGGERIQVGGESREGKIVCLREQ